MLLKDLKTNTEDPRLDFIPYKDERSKDYKAVNLLKPHTASPKALELRYSKYYVGEWFNQRAEGSCVGHALAHGLVSSPNRIKKYNGTKIGERFALELYWDAQRIDPWPGGSFPGANPRYEGTTLLAGLKTLKKNYNLINEYRWAFGEEELALSVSHIGPAIVGIPWYDSFYEPDPVTNYISLKGRDGRMSKRVGGHAIVVAGIDPNEQRGERGSARGGTYFLWNSWGRDYGINGWCKITREDMAVLLAEDGEAALIF